MSRILSGESYSSVKSDAASLCMQQAAATDVPLKSVCDSGIDSIRDMDKSGMERQRFCYSITNAMGSCS